MKFLLSLRLRPPAPVPDPFSLEAIARAAKARHYGDGVAHGMEIVLRLLLGKPMYNARPYRGELPDELERWARDALARAQETAP